MRLRAMMPLSMLTLTLLPTAGCVTRTVVDQISADRYVRSVRAGVPFTPPVDGKFVPAARFKELSDAYVRDSFRK